jgi:heme-degrading monooxygenase HmoA
VVAVIADVPSVAVVVVTTMHSPRLAPLVRARRRARRIEREVREKAPGFLWAQTSLSLRQRRLMSVSLWQSVEAVQAMGSVGSHIDAAHYAVRAGLTTHSGVFAYEGHWSAEVYGVRRRADATRGAPGVPLEGRP